jgi:hypothetical protein
MYLCISSFFHSSALQTQGFEVHKCLYTANSGNTVAYSTAWSNGTSLDLRGANGNTLWENRWYGDRGNAAALSSSHENAFYFDQFACAPGHSIVLQDSDDNRTHQVRVGCPVRREQSVASR